MLGISNTFKFGLRTLTSALLYILETQFFMILKTLFYSSNIPQKKQLIFGLACPGIPLNYVIGRPGHHTRGMMRLNSTFSPPLV